MATINEIANAAAYRGDAALGGYIPSAIEIETQPIETLAAYTVAQNKSFYDQRQKDADVMVAELARLSQYNIANARGKDKEEAIQAYAQLQDYARQYAMSGVPRNPEEKIRKEAEFKARIAETTTKIDALNERGIAYNAQLDAINSATTTAEVKDLQIKSLNDNFDNTSWDTPLSALPNYQIQLPPNIEPKYTKTEMNYRDANGNYKTEINFLNQKSILAEAQAISLGLMDELPANATPNQRAQWEYQQALYPNGTVRDMATNINEVFNQFRGADGQIDEQRLLASGNEIAINAYNLMKSWNEYADNGNAAIRQNQYVTRDGKTVLNIANVVPQGTFVRFDLSQPITSQQLLAAQAFAKASPDSKQETFTFTGEGLQQQRIDIDRAEANAKINAPGTQNAADVIIEPAQAYLSNIQRRAGFFRGNNRQFFELEYGAIDPLTRSSLGLEEGQAVRFLRNGGFAIYEEKSKTKKGQSQGWNLVKQVPEDVFLKGVTAFYKGGLSESGGVDEKSYRMGAEQGYVNTFGTIDAKQAYTNVFNQVLGIGTQQNEPNSQTTPNTKTVTVNGVEKEIVLPN